ncbi:DUF1667 domain-containing protein [Mycoplasmatota bacterium WC44]
MKKIECIICPNSCILEVDGTEVKGHLCKRGVDFALEEITAPKRSICSTVRTDSKYDYMIPVKTDGRIPKDLIFPVMELINKYKLTKEVRCGDVVIENALNTGVNIVVTFDYHRDNVC